MRMILDAKNSLVKNKIYPLLVSRRKEGEKIKGVEPMSILIGLLIDSFII